MPFKTKCPGCEKLLDVPDAVVGKRVKCPACAHQWQVPAPAGGQPAASPAKAAYAMTKCPGCGKAVQIPGSMAGKRVKCPACAHVWQIPGPGPVVDAESVPESPKAGEWFDELMNNEYPIAAPAGRPAATGGQSSFGAASGPAGEPPRRPCPHCGEMIVATAAKCRFCNAVFDEALRRAEKKKKKRRSWSSGDDDLTAGDWVVCILCPGIGCIGGLIYLIMGRPKAWKVLGVSFLAAMVQGIIRVAIVASQAPNAFR